MPAGTKVKHAPTVPRSSSILALLILTVCLLIGNTAFCLNSFTHSAQGAAVTQTPNGLDQIGTRTHAQRGFGVVGSVNPQATLEVFHPLNTPAGETLTQNAQTGVYAGFWNLPVNWNSGAAGVWMRWSAARSRARA